jgi:hypothetical protein
LQRAAKWQAERCWLVLTLLHLSSVTHSHTNQWVQRVLQRRFVGPQLLYGYPYVYEKIFRHGPPEISEKNLLCLSDTQWLSDHTPIKQSKINYSSSRRLFLYSVSASHSGDLSSLLICCMAASSFGTPNLSHFPNLTFAVQHDELTRREVCGHWGRFLCQMTLTNRLILNGSALLFIVCKMINDLNLIQGGPWNFYASLNTPTDLEKNKNRQLFPRIRKILNSIALVT